MGFLTPTYEDPVKELITIEEAFYDCTDISIDYEEVADGPAMLLVLPIGITSGLFGYGLLRLIRESELLSLTPLSLSVLSILFIIFIKLYDRQAKKGRVLADFETSKLPNFKIYEGIITDKRQVKGKYQNYKIEFDGIDFEVNKQLFKSAKVGNEAYLVELACGKSQAYAIYDKSEYALDDNLSSRLS